MKGGGMLFLYRVYKDWNPQKEQKKGKELEKSPLFH